MQACSIIRGRVSASSLGPHPAGWLAKELEEAARSFAGGTRKRVVLRTGDYRSHDGGIPSMAILRALDGERHPHSCCRAAANRL